MIRPAAMALLLLAAACATHAPSPPADLIIVAPRMLDVRAGAYLEKRAVIIRDGRIASIESAASAQHLSATERITLPEGTTLLPGLIDAHVHLAWTGAPNADAARLTLLAGFTTVRNPGAKELRAATTARVRRARELGVPIVFGTDATVLPHGENAREFASLLALGLTPIEALRAATIDAAKLIGWQHRVGSIEPGFEADLIVVTNDVLTTLVPLDVKVVVARGRIVRNELAVAR